MRGSMDTLSIYLSDARPDLSQDVVERAAEEHFAAHEDEGMPFLVLAMGLEPGIAGRLLASPTYKDGNFWYWRLQSSPEASLLRRFIGQIGAPHGAGCLMFERRRSLAAA